MIRCDLLLILLCCGFNGAAQVEACLLEPDPGPCEAAIPAWHFDPLTQMCTEFTWGGCEGVVPFPTLAACQASGCVGDTLSYPICDSISVTALSFGTWPSGVDHLAILVEPFFTSMVWVAYCGFALSDANGHLIAAETNETAPNFYGFGSAPGYPEERFLDLEPGVDLQGSPPPCPGPFASSRGGWPVVVATSSANGPGQSSTSRRTSGPSSPPNRWPNPSILICSIVSALQSPGAS